jgi:hypothetical protein
MPGEAMIETGLYLSLPQPLFFTQTSLRSIAYDRMLSSTGLGETCFAASPER